MIFALDGHGGGLFQFPLVTVQGLDMVCAGFQDATRCACGGSECLKMGFLGARRCDLSYLQTSTSEQTHCFAMGLRFIPAPERVLPLT